MTIREAAILLYEELFRQVTLNRNFRYKPIDNEMKTLDKFVVWMEGKYGEKLDADLMMKYFEFQFSRYSNFQNKQYGAGRIMFNWLIGSKAIETWEKRDANDLKYLFKARRDILLKFKKIFKPLKDRRRMEIKFRIFNELSSTEETAKCKFYNKPEGFIFCQLETTLYHPLSEICRGCIFKDECKELLTQDYKSIAQIREVV